MRTATRFVILAAVLPVSSLAQEAPRTEQVTYENPVDGITLSATLTVPSGEGPFAGVVVLSIAGVDDLIDRLASLGYEVLRPERRGMMAVDLMLEATFEDLANDARAAVEFLRARPEVDPERVGIVGQGEEVSGGGLV